MVKNLKLKKAVIIGFTALLFVASIAFITVAALRENNFSEVSIYYLNTNTNRLEPESRMISDSTPDEMANAIIALLFENPRSGSLQTTVPAGLETPLSSPPLLGLSNSALVMIFPESYRDIPPIDEALFRASLVWSLTELPFIETVCVLIEGEDLSRADELTFGYADRSKIKIDAQLNPRKAETRTFNLFFAAEDLSGLLVEQRTAEVNPTSPAEYYIVEQLITGTSQSGLISAISSDTKIRSVRTVGGICTVNLSAEFVSRFIGNPVLAELTLYSIVHSITANVANVRSVQFLVESERVQQFNGVNNFDMRFEPNEKYLSQSP